MSKDFFPPRPEASPTIYAYELQGVASHEGLIKVGYTARASTDRIAEQLGTVNIKPHILMDTPAVREDGTYFTDHDVHRVLRKKGIVNTEKEWFACTILDVQAAIQSVKRNDENIENRTLSFGMRPEQEEAINKTITYFEGFKQENPSKVPHFLWNAKMRFGKTFSTYQLAKKKGWKKILVLTFKPAVQNAWEEDLLSHVDFEGWQFVTGKNPSVQVVDSTKPIICFGSFQDFLGKNSAGGIKVKNEWVHSMQWDCIVLDEYHFGAWRENAKSLFGAEEPEVGEVELEYKNTGEEYFDEKLMPITTDAYLYLSGTPFRAIASGEFIEEQIFNWTYADEQRAKENWDGEKNPYASLPRMVMMTYQLPDSIREIALKGEYNEFDLNLFFSADGEGEDAKFKYEDEVQKWLDLIRGSHPETTIDNLKLGAKKPPMPFSHAPLLNVLTHTFWYLPSVASCHAMKNLLAQRQNKFYHDYETVVAAGVQAGIGVEALKPVRRALSNPLKTKTITFSCGKLTTGVSVPSWTGIFMLRNSSSPETYFQAAFRVQTPWTIKNPDGLTPNEEEVLKNECYVFDFAPNRALRQIVDYSDRLDISETNPETKVAEFIHFLPVLAYDGSSMKQIDAAGILDIATSGTTATLLARRWESALLVNVDNETLQRLMSNPDAMNALMSIEGFRGLNQEIETLINKSETINRLKQEASERELTAKETRELTEEEKEYKSKRKQIQEKLIKFATRIPIFMYLTDYRERTLRDVITQLEPGLFKKVTGLTLTDFELLVSLGVFNAALMNDAVYKFRRYEDSSLTYTGVNKHEGESIGLYDTVIGEEDYNQTFENISN